MVNIYLDESGDLGFKKDGSQSDYFLITFIACEDKGVLEKVVKKVHRSLRKNVKKLPSGLLHCTREKPKTRMKLLRLLQALPISIMTICLNKSKVYTNLREERHILYNYVTNILLDRIMTKRLVSKSGSIQLIASKRETNRFLNDNFSTYLETQVKRNHDIRINIVIRTPGEEKALQAVNFVCWSIFRKYEYKEDGYYQVIKGKIIEENTLFGLNMTKP